MEICRYDAGYCPVEFVQARAGASEPGCYQGARSVLPEAQLCHAADKKCCTL